MCSKTAEPQTPAPARPLARWTLGRPSITRRLTVLYVVSTTALLVLAAGFLYWTLKRNLDATRYGMLTSKIELLRLLLREPDKAAVLADEVEHEASGSHPLKYFIRILDGQGRVLLETPGLHDLVPVGLFPAPVEVAAEPLRSIARESLANRSFLLLSVHATARTGGDQKRTLQMALDITTGTALLADYRRKLLAALGLGMVLAAVAGVWVARKGMQPVVEITKTAQRITVSHLHDRIAGSRWPAELAELAAAFDAMLDRLEGSFMRLSQFSADLAHALRSPINNLRGEAEVALARARSPEEYQHVLASGLEEHERLSRMIDGLLFLARADDPQAAVERVRFDARKQIEAVREFYEALASEEAVEVTCEGEAWLTGDPMLFRRAVSNLLANALRYTPAHGSVRISVGAREDQTVELTVRDTGAGVAPEHLPRVFDRFYRAGESLSHVPGGTGLGLAIVRSIMRLHGGVAAIQSRLGEGTTVTLQFPPDVPAGAASQMTKM